MHPDVNYIEYLFKKGNGKIKGDEAVEFAGYSVNLEEQDYLIESILHYFK